MGDELTQVTRRCELGVRDPVPLEEPADDGHKRTRWATYEFFPLTVARCADMAVYCLGGSGSL